MMTNRARLWHGTPFGADALFGEDYTSLLSSSASRSGPRLPALLVRKWCCSCMAGEWCFPRQENVRQKKYRKLEKEEGKAFRSERTVNFGPKGQRFLNQKVFVHFLSSAPFLSMLRHRRAPSWFLPCVCTLTSSACAGRHLDVFGCQKQT